MISLITKKHRAGFTLLELMVSVAIISLITGITLYNQKNFSDQVSLQNTVSDVELTVREAQSYSIAVREFAAGTGEFAVAYGASLILAGSGSSNTSYFSFVDRKVLNYKYDTPSVCLPGTDPDSECLKKNTLTGRNIISDICAIRSDLSEVCNGSVARVDISFKRPNPNAILVFMNPGGNETQSGSIGARIKFTSPSGVVSSLYVYTSGQIAVQ